MSLPPLLYLGFAFPPGLRALYPHINPAGHLFETRMVAALRQHFDIRSVGLLPLAPARSPAGADPASGVQHALLLQERAPLLFWRYRSLLSLRRHYTRWRASGWRPAATLVYNLSPVYNAFVRGLQSQGPEPKRVLLLLDSSQLGRPLSRLKQLRYQLKPLVVPDAQMLGHFDGCVGLSRATEPYAAARGLPFLWMPGACAPRTLEPRAPGLGGASLPGKPLRFGYFGALADHSGILKFADIFLNLEGPATLHICGYGKLSDRLAAMARQNPRLEFRGLLPTPEDCLSFGRECDVLVNPRPPTHGNANNFASKLFEYALCGRAILTSQLSGEEVVLGQAAFYFDAHDYESSLRTALSQLAGQPPEELRRRGWALRERVGTEYSWPRQAARMAAFIQHVVSNPAGATPPL